MASFGVAWIVAGLAFLALDAVWLSQMAPRVYQPVIGPIMAEKFNALAAGLFYVLYVTGMVVFVISPTLGQSVGKTVLLGAFLGTIAYGAYDLSNMATLKAWSWPLTLIDMAWGAVATAIAASAAHLAVNHFAR